MKGNFYLVAGTKVSFMIPGNYKELRSSKFYHSICIILHIGGKIIKNRIEFHNMDIKSKSSMDFNFSDERNDILKISDIKAI